MSQDIFSKFLPGFLALFRNSLKLYLPIFSIPFFAINVAAIFALCLKTISFGVICSETTPWEDFAASCTLFVFHGFIISVKTHKVKRNYDLIVKDFGLVV